MAIACYLAMTAAEFSACNNLPAHVGWLACHFSPSGPGLSNLPKNLPPQSLLIIDDSTPFHEHQSDVILRQLQEIISALDVHAVLLDFQRPSTPDVQKLVAVLQEQLSCQVLAPPQYVTDHSPLFVPPCPLNIPLEKHLAPYQGREIWLDVAPLPVQITVTEKGTATQLLQIDQFQNTFHREPTLHCNYHIAVYDDRVEFSLTRDSQALQCWLEKAQALGVAATVGLYQEWIK